ncbi:Inositol monophosphatase 1 [Fusarium oxysporum f. sp. albedinis]|nr:Inositol monophosphatase 1 [Fusarium oxysporum f. sp. albedinis]
MQLISKHSDERFTTSEESPKPFPPLIQISDYILLAYSEIRLPFIFPLPCSVVRSNTRINIYSIKPRSLFEILVPFLLADKCMRMQTKTSNSCAIISAVS